MWFSKGVSEEWLKNPRLALVKFRRFLRLERGLGEESHETPLRLFQAASGLPVWLVSELERYQHVQQRNWRAAQLQNSIRRFWSGYLRIWRFLVEQKYVQELKDVKRQHVLDYVDLRLGAGYSVHGVNADLRCLHTFLLFLQEEGYPVAQSLLRIPGLKEPENSAEVPHGSADAQIA